MQPYQEWYYQILQEHFGKIGDETLARQYKAIRKKYPGAKKTKGSVVAEGGQKCHYGPEMAKKALLSAATRGEESPYAPWLLNCGESFAQFRASITDPETFFGDRWAQWFSGVRNQTQLNELRLHLLFFVSYIMREIIYSGYYWTANWEQLRLYYCPSNLRRILLGTTQESVSDGSQSDKPSYGLQNFLDQLLLPAPLTVFRWAPEDNWCLDNCPSEELDGFQRETHLITKRAVRDLCIFLQFSTRWLSYLPDNFSFFAHWRYDPQEPIASGDAMLGMTLPGTDAFIRRHNGEQFAYEFEEMRTAPVDYTDGEDRELGLILNLLRYMNTDRRLGTHQTQAEDSVAIGMEAPFNDRDAAEDMAKAAEREVKEQLDEPEEQAKRKREYRYTVLGSNLVFNDIREYQLKTGIIAPPAATFVRGHWRRHPLWYKEDIPWGCGEVCLQSMDSNAQSGRVSPPNSLEQFIDRFEVCFSDLCPNAMEEEIKRRNQLEMEQAASEGRPPQLLTRSRSLNRREMERLLCSHYWFHQMQGASPPLFNHPWWNPTWNSEMVHLCNRGHRSMIPPNWIGPEGEKLLAVTTIARVTPESHPHIFEEYEG